MQEYMQAVPRSTGGVTVCFDPAHTTDVEPAAKITADMRARLGEDRWRLMNRGCDIRVLGA
jgi:hypothetical protein